MPFVARSMLICCLLAALPAHGAPAGRCRTDDDCRFAFVNTCRRQCPPCAPRPWRQAMTTKRFAQLEELWAVKRVRCRTCARRCKPRWRGDRAVCKSGRCAVVERGVVTLTDLARVRVGAQVYRLAVVWDKAQQRFIPQKPLKMPYHHASRIEWHGIELRSLASSRPLWLEVIITEREIVKVSAQHRWRATYHAEVIHARPGM